MIYGLAAALGWGFADLGAAIASRRIGSLVVVVLAQLAGFGAIAVLFLVVRPAWRGSGQEVLLLLANGILVAAAYVLHYRALELGPVALVAPLSAAYAVIPIALAVVILGESLALPVLAGATLTILGIVLITTDPRQLHDAARASRAGLPYAFAAMVLFGIASFIFGRAAQRMGWLTAVGLGRTFTMAALLLFVGLRRPGLAAGGRSVLGSTLVGLVDVVGIAAYSRGAEVGLISQVSAVSAIFPIIPFLGGLTFFRERPGPSQILGVGLVMVGLILLGLG